MKKYIKYTVGLCLLTSLGMMQVSCSDMLDQYPQGQWTENDREGKFETQYLALYGKVRGFGVTSGTVALAIHSFRSEDVEKGSSAADGAIYASMFDNFEYSPNNDFIQVYWNEHFSIIHGANDVIYDMKAFVDEGNKLSEADQIGLAEAHFFRAYAYFDLVRAFGEVPLIDFKLIKGPEEANVPKSSVNDIYGMIDSDLDFAVKGLPAQWDNSYIGRLTSGAAKAMRARTFMMRSDWGNMYSYAMDVINTGLYDLKTPFAKIFRESGENTSESVFEIQCTASESLPESNKLGSQYAQVQGVRGDANWNLGWGWNTPTQNLADAFETSDPRKDETLLYFAKSAGEAAGMTPNKPYNEIPIAQGNVSNKYYNKKVYTDPTFRNKYAKSGYWVNIRMIRTSDVYLMAAEAANELGNVAAAGELLEQIRERARGGNNAVLPKRTTEDPNEMREYIHHERRVELAMEWDRFYDLVRWGVAKKVLHAAGKTNYQDRHALLPLPQAEVEKSNGVLIQNPNY